MIKKYDNSSGNLKTSLPAALVLSLSLLASCEFLQFKKDREPEEGPRLLARVREHYLYASDVADLIPAGTTPEDSADLIERHVKGWIRKQLLIEEARAQLGLSEAEIERKVLDYRYALMMHEFEQAYVNQRLDPNVSPGEVEQYYKENTVNFLLDRNLFRGILVQVPRAAPKMGRFRQVFRSARPADIEELKTYCYSYAVKAHLEDSAWVVFSDLLATMPLPLPGTEQRLLQSGKYHEIADDEYIYFLRVDEYRLQSEPSPLEFVENDIRRIIVHKRRVDLAKQLEEEIYKKALHDEEFEVYN
jgi:hypothetical protein